METDPSASKAPYKIYNIGNNNPVKLLDFIEAIEESLNKKAQKNFYLCSLVMYHLLMQMFQI